MQSAKNAPRIESGARMQRRRRVPDRERQATHSQRNEFLLSRRCRREAEARSTWTRSLPHCQRASSTIYARSNFTTIRLVPALATLEAFRRSGTARFRQRLTESNRAVGGCFAMRWVTVASEEGPRACGVVNGEYIDVNAADPEMPASVRELLALGLEWQRRAWDALPRKEQSATTLPM